MQRIDIIQLTSAAGIGGIIGSLLTTMIQAWLSNKPSIAHRNFQEKKEKIEETNLIGGTVSPNRPLVMRELKEAMRKDLKVDPSR